MLIDFRRFDRLREKDANFKERWQHLGELSIQAEFNWDEEIESDSAVDLNNT